MKRPIATYKEMNDHLAGFGYEIKSLKGLGQLDSRQCWLVELEVLDFTTGELMTCKGIQSYETIVAVVIEKHLLKTAFIGKYSSTTTQQVNKAMKRWNLDYDNYIAKGGRTDK